MCENSLYASFGDFEVKYIPENSCFNVSYGGKNVLENAQISENATGTRISELKTEYFFDTLTNGLKALLKTGESNIVEFKLNNEGLTITIVNSYSIQAQAYWIDEANTYAVSTENTKNVIRCAIGPATSLKDNALYNKIEDNALVFEGGENVSLRYNWEKKCYDVKLVSKDENSSGKFKIYVKNNVLAEEYKFDFAPINKNSTFKKPPAGWMTWYAVKFEAGEKTVLENLAFQEKYLKKYGADAFWIDWEWYHKDLSGTHHCADSFTPDKEKYPNGLKVIADKIKEAGFVPALWIGFVDDVADNEYTKENPEIILVKDETWCGTYYYDFTHPKYLNEFLPKALKNVMDWGYEAFKFDTLEIAMERQEKYHHKLYDPRKTSKDAYRGMIKKVREVIGENTYLLLCTMLEERMYFYAPEVFDAARVGADIFKWDEFIKNGINEVIPLYPLHNVSLYADPDNVILREEFSTYNQAATRIYFVSLLGLMMTFGDDFKVLTDDRVSLIKKCLPVMDIHPKDLKPSDKAEGELLINLSIALPFENYNVINVVNLKDEETKRIIYFEKDLQLENDEYHIFDFENEKYIGSFSESFEIENKACQSRILSVRKKTGDIQLLSTSRHVTQGAAEIKAFEQTEKSIKFSAELVDGEEYRIYLYVPFGKSIKRAGNMQIDNISDEIYCIKYTPSECETYTFEILFE